MARALITSNFAKDGGRGKTEEKGNVRSSNGELPRKRTDKLDVQRGGGGGGLGCGSGAGGRGLQSADIMTQRGEGRMWHLTSLIS